MVWFVIVGEWESSCSKCWWYLVVNLISDDYLFIDVIKGLIVWYFGCECVNNINL